MEFGIASRLEVIGGPPNGQILGGPGGSTKWVRKGGTFVAAPADVVNLLTEGRKHRRAQSIND
jgi:hypothetical protein